MRQPPGDVSATALPTDPQIRPFSKAALAALPWVVTAGLALLAAFAAVSVVAFVVPLGTTEDRARLATVGGPLVTLVRLLIVGAPAFDRRLPLRARRAWLAIAAAFASTLIGNSIWSYETLGGGTHPDVSGIDVANLVFCGLLAYGLLRLPSAALRRHAALFWLDVAALVLSASVFEWHFVVAPRLGQGAARLLADITADANAWADVVPLFALSLLWLSLATPTARWIMGPFAVGMGLVFVTDILYVYQVRAGTFVDGGSADTVWSVAVVLQALTGARQLRAPLAWTEEHDAPSRPHIPLQVVPLAGVASVFVLLLFAAATGPARPILDLAIGAALITVLVVVRQVVAGREHVALLAETAARRSEAWFRALVQNSADVTIVLDPDHRIRFASPALQRMLRYEPWELAGRPLRDLAFDEDAENVDDLFKRLSREPGQSATREVRLRSKDDSAVAAEVVATNLLEEPLVHGLVFNVRDVSERKALEARLTHQAFHDDLTGLPNRALFLDRVERALARSTRSHEHVAVLFIDLDDFKVVNDSLGHTAGDRFLAAVAQRFAACVRASDTLARLGGDEFAILMEGWHGVERVFDVAGRITQSLETPLRIDDRARVGASIGIAFSQDGRTPDDLLRNADVAMYRAKLYGKGTYEVFEPEMLTSLRRRLETEADLRKAVESAGFCVQYQRIVRLEDAATTGVEALVRWRHPRRGLLSPAEFIPLAEDTGLIVPIQRFVLVEACREVLALRSRPGGGAPLTLAINVSGRHFQSETIVSDVASALERTGFDPKSLVIEITESVLLHPGSATLKALAELKAMGVLLSLDDFGTGYSALGYLQRFPLDILKIDGSFVAHIEEGETAIVKAVIALGAALGLETVAEGVETAGQARTLRALGCPRAQGFYFGRPAFVDELVL